MKTRALEVFSVAGTLWAKLEMQGGRLSGEVAGAEPARCCRLATRRWPRTAESAPASRAGEPAVGRVASGFRGAALAVDVLTLSFCYVDSQ